MPLGKSKDLTSVEVRAWCDYVQWAADHNEDEPSVLQRACRLAQLPERQKGTPRNLTWTLKISPWKRKVHLETIIFRFHVEFPGF